MLVHLVTAGHRVPDISRTLVTIGIDIVLTQGTVTVRLSLIHMYRSRYKIIIVGNLMLGVLLLALMISKRVVN